MADDPTPTTERKGCTCEFCGSTLSANGDVIKRGDKARAMMDLEETAARTARDLDTATARVTELQAEVDRLKAAPEPPATKKKYGRFE